MTDKDGIRGASGGVSSNTRANTSSLAVNTSATPSQTTQTTNSTKNAKQKNLTKRSKEGSSLAPSGAQIIENTGTMRYNQENSNIKQEGNGQSKGNNQNKQQKAGSGPQQTNVSSTVQNSQVNESNQKQDGNKRHVGNTSTMEYRLDYCCNFLQIKKDQAKEMTVLDFCLDDIGRMDFVQHFVNIKELTLSNQSIQIMEGLDRLKQLEKCWLTHNQFESIKSFDKLRNIRELYLGYNRITRTSGLEKCYMLEKLWIDHNQIDTIIGLNSLERLEHLNLAANNIETIGVGLDGLVSLGTLNLAANKIGNFKEILNLNRLNCLSVCMFADSHYGDNPICNLCNYKTYVLYHLPKLYRLDTEMISEDSKNFSEGTFMKKRMYYNMRIKTIQRNTSNILKLLKISRKVRSFKLELEHCKLTKRLNEIIREIEERKHISQTNHEEFEQLITYGAENLKRNPLDSINNDRLFSNLETKANLINGRLYDKQEDMKEVHGIYEAMRKEVYNMSEQNIHRLITELETGGNIRFEEGQPTDKWFTSCVDLVRSRFNPEQMKVFGITGIQVNRVTRIHNRFLRNRFEDKLEQLVDLSDSSYKRNLEYLFYGIDPAQPNELHRVMEEGFRSQNDYYESILPNCIPLVNSVSSAEIGRINSHFQGEDGYQDLKSATRKSTNGRLGFQESDTNYPSGMNKIPSGQLLVCKVYLAKCVSDLNYPYFNPSHAPSEIWKYAPVDTKMYSHVSSIFRTKENDQKQRLWFVFDHALVLPEYLVEFDYTLQNSVLSLEDQKKISDSTFLNSECNRLFKGVAETLRALDDQYLVVKKNPRLQQVHLTTNDLDRSDMASLKKKLFSLMVQFHIKELIDNNNIFKESEQMSVKTAVEDSMPPEIPTRSQFSEITIDIIKNISREFNLSNITYLNLFNNNLKKIGEINTLTNLKILILSFNMIEEIEGLQNCNFLIKIDLHNNYLRQIKGLEGKTQLTYLDVSCNRIDDIQSLDHVKIQCPNLKELGLHSNIISSNQSYRALVFQKINDLSKLDGISFTDKDKRGIEGGSKVLTIDLIYDQAKNQGKNVEPQSAFLIETADEEDQQEWDENRLTENRKEKHLKSEWEKQTEQINLSHLQLSVIKNLDIFSSLRKLVLMDNNIEKIQGLENCKLLEELSLEKNKIRVIENLGHLKYLKKLDLGQNLITTIQNISQLESLTQLSLEDNQISKLTGFEDMQTLMELYLGNNLIDEIKEIINLKELQRLIILDISGNNLIREENYRIYCIFHLRRLRVLDGLSIENAECIEAKETFAGRLTQEILEQRLSGFTLATVKELDLTGCKLRDFDKMFDREFCPNLRELNLSHNFFATLRGFGYLPQLRILKIKQNRLETLFCKLNSDGYPRGLFGLSGLEVLDVSYNSLHDLYGIQFAPLKDLKILHASNNEITKIDFLEKLKLLRELDLSKNRIRQIDPNSFANQLAISVLKLEDNGLRTLANIERLERLQAFHGGGNRLAEFWELDRLAELVYLMEISLTNNPITRKPQYRMSIIRKLQNLIVLDGKEITIDERNRIETSQIYEQQKAPSLIHYSQYPSAKVPVKMNAVNFDGVFGGMKYAQGLEGSTPQGVNNMIGNQKGNLNFPGVQGLSINGQGQNMQGGQVEMGGLIQVQGLQQQMQGNNQNSLMVPGSNNGQGEMGNNFQNLIGTNRFKVRQAASQHKPLQPNQRQRGPLPKGI